MTLEYTRQLFAGLWLAAALAATTGGTGDAWLIWLIATGLGLWSTFVVTHLHPKPLPVVAGQPHTGLR